MAQATRLKVFISCWRADEGFADELMFALQDRGYDGYNRYRTRMRHDDHDDKSWLGEVGGPPNADVLQGLA